MSTLNLMTTKVSAVLLEDHPLFREGLRSFITQKFPNISFAYCGADFLEAKEVIERERVNLAILDLHLGDSRTPSEIVSLFSTRHMRVLVISALNNFESVKSAFSMGANGFVSKDSPIEEIGKAIKTVLDGNEWISPTLSSALTYSKSPIEQLSAQEKRAVILYASGLKLEVVARRMNVAASTSKQYIDRAKMKFKNAGVTVRTKTEIYKYLRDQGLIE
jgi:two-component system nitrate/nitrite response regulator NarL